ncbi:MAG TPA: hypothetical protein VMX75_14455 [Spirochaetia bacterium]|nr:hypothetical protein [Spirochaetia bacterium]
MSNNRNFGSTNASGDAFHELPKAIENQNLDSMAVQERIQQFLGRIGELMLQEVLEGVGSLFTENRVVARSEEYQHSLGFTAQSFSPKS